MRRALACVGLALLLGMGCSGERDARELLGPTGKGTIVVDARLIVGYPLPSIILTTTESPDRPWDVGATAVRGATAIITWTDPIAGPDTAFYGQGARSGFYEIQGITGYAGVLSGTTYSLRVEVPDGRVVTAQTTTPDFFMVREWVLLDDATLTDRRQLVRGGSQDSVYQANQLIYQDGIVEARFDRGTALAFQMALFNMEEDSPLLIDADFLSESDKASLERETSSPPLEAPDGYVRLPWLAVWYEGRHQFRVYSVDRNWFDLARSARFNGPANLGFGSSAGDNFERPIFHINGGIGLFGSASMDRIYFSVMPRP